MFNAANRALIGLTSLAITMLVMASFASPAMNSPLA